MMVFGRRLLTVLLFMRLTRDLLYLSYFIPERILLGVMSEAVSVMGSGVNLFFSLVEGKRRRDKYLRFECIGNMIR